MREDKKLRSCIICGCTDENACITDEGPCWWAYETARGPVCSGCVVELPPDPKRSEWPHDNLLVERVCVNCAQLIKDQYRGKPCYTCCQGHFDDEPAPGEVRAKDYHHWFAFSGVRYPNKTVAAAREECREWLLHSRFRPTSEAEK